jgi:predicted RNA binding protein YcfA (HicA-like mRNA interferase family)
MGERTPRITAHDIVRALQQCGFRFARQSGSHAIYINAKGKRVTVPVHAGKILHPKVLKSILRDADMTAEKLRELL